MKPQSTVTELFDTAVPLHGDPARDYDWLSLVKTYAEIDGGIQVTVESYEGRWAHVRLQFVTPEILRVQSFIDREPPASTPMLVDLPPPPEVRVTETDGAIEVASASLRLRVSPAPLAVRDQNSRPAPPGVRVAGGETAPEQPGSSLRPRVEPGPFRWTLFDSEGAVVAAQEVQDGGMGEFISCPAGWSQREGEPPDFHETLKLRADEGLFGLGESFGPLNRRGSRVVAWSRDTHGTSTTPLTYLNIPFFISTRGYGVFINHTSRIVYELGYPSQVTSSFRVEDPYLDYFVICGPEPKEVLARYWQLTGRGALPPLWSFGVWMSRCMYRDAEQVQGVVERMRELEIPLDVVNVDPRWLENRKHHEADACDFVWDTAAFGEPEQFTGWLRERNVRLCLWENPYVWRDTPFYEEARAKGYLALGPDGEPVASLDNPREAAVFDFTNREAARWWQEQHRRYLRAGVAAFKSDYGEGVPADARLSDGTTGRQTHNVYPLLYNRAVWDVIQEERGEAIVFARSGYAGSQRYPINWVGDTQCTFEGMAAALRAGLSLSLSGIPFWSHDIGGFWNPPDPGKGPDPTLYIRWAQWGLLSSHARFHGIRGREPWWFGDEAVEIVRRFARLRYRLLPYLWSFANDAVRTATPLVRPLLLDYPDDPTTHYLDSQYLLGPWLLVAPVFDPQGRVRVYLPSGRWHDFWSGEAIEGPRWLSQTAPLDRLPVYVRDDSLLPMGPEQTYVGERAWAPLEIAVRVSNEAALQLEGVELQAEARREGENVTLELSGKADLALRFVSPHATTAEVSGEASDVHREQVDGALTLRLRLAGDARVSAR
jgi:alpha-D-xyloside xylohydrolase